MIFKVLSNQNHSMIPTLIKTKSCVFQQLLYWTQESQKIEQDQISLHQDTKVEHCEKTTQR